MGINGIIKTETDYRSLKMDSSSSLKEFSLDRKKYYRKYILGEKIEEKDTTAILTGQLAEIFLLEPHRFDEKFHLSTCESKPSGLMGEFIDALIAIREENTNDEGEVSISFENALKEAYNRSGFKLPYEAVIKKFKGSDAEIYFNEMEDVRKKGLTVVSMKEVENAEKIAEEIKSNRFTSFILERGTDDIWETHIQYQVEGYEVHNHFFKSMIDIVQVNHKKKTIQAYDLKVVWNVEGFYEDYYLYRRAYIQAYLYYRALHYISLTNDAYKGYSVLPIRFIVADSANYYSPLIYVLSEEDIAKAYSGFEYKGRMYKGVKDIIEDLIFAQEGDVWNVSRENYNNNGLVKLTKHD